MILKIQINIKVCMQRYLLKLIFQITNNLILYWIKQDRDKIISYIFTAYLVKN